MLQIQILDSDGHLVHQISLGEEPITIGRDPECDLCLHDCSLSRQHVTLERRESGHVVRDLASTNGTWVNRQQVSEHGLQRGDVVHIGSHRIRVLEKTSDLDPDDRPAHPASARLEQAGFPFDSRSDGTVQLDLDGRLRELTGGQSLLERLVSLQDVTRGLAFIDTPEFLTRKILGILLQELAADRACVLFRDSASGQLIPANAATRESEAGASIDVSPAVVEAATHDRRAILAANPEGESRSENGAQASVRSVMCAPLVASDEVLGALYVDRTTSLCEFDEADLRILAVLANQVAISLNNARLFQDVLAEKRRVQAVIEHLSDGVLMTNEALVIERSNDAADRLFSSRGSLLGTNLADVLAGCADDFDPKLVEDAAAGSSFQISIRRHGEPRVFSVSRSSYPGLNGAELGCVFSFKDMTQYVNLAVLKSEFIRLASHKLKTPLTVLMGSLDVLENGPLDAEERPVIVEGVSRNLKKLQALVNRFVEFAELDQVEAPFEDVYVSDVVSAAWAGLADRADQRGIVLEEQDLTEETAPIVQGIFDRLVQCFTNILDNAVRYSPESSTVRVELRDGNGGLEVSVHDDGPGIPCSHLPYVFSGFHQVEAMGTGEAAGVGLGLTISKRILHLHGATIEASNESPDERPGGTVITMTFPCHAARSLSTETIDADFVATL